MDTKEFKIAVAGTGYVGLSIATLLSQHHQVTAVDVIPEKVDMLNRKQSPIQDEYIEKFLSEKELNLTATLDGTKAYSDADFVVIAAPTNYDPVKHYFDTHHIEVRHYEYTDILETYGEFEKLSRTVKIMDTVRLMKKVVPEFKSKNSPRFEVLDK